MRSALLLLPLLPLAGPATAQEPVPSEEALRGAYPSQTQYSPYAGRSFPAQVFWGDTHLHTGMSMDAGAFGARLSPTDAYRFAKGEEVVTATGQRARLSRPLDFLVVADHSDNMGFFPRLYAGDPDMLRDPTGKRWYDMAMAGGEEGMKAAVEIIIAFSNNEFPPALASLPGTPAYRSAWEQTLDAAEEANDPGHFTAFIGYEWTSNAGGDNLHRVVIYRGDAIEARQMEPYTTLPPLGSPDPKDLWKWMQEYEDRTGGEMLAIAHNGNLSNGIMFPYVDSFTDEPIDLAYAETRARWEPLYEVTQIKGDGETHPFLSPTDEFADYETWAIGNLDLSVLKEDEMLQFEYARSALGIGMQIEQRLGVNPYKFGMIGSTDSHTGMATGAEENFFGKHAGTEPNPMRWKHPMAKVEDREYPGWSMAASGWAAVWATENTREAIFDAMMRKETYATTGSRMIVRFFGGWEFSDEDAAGRLPAWAGYTKGVPMGGDLPAPDLHRADLPGRRAEGPAVRQPGPHPDRQGLGGRGRGAAREGPRRGLVRRPGARRRRQAAAGRRHRRRGQGDLDEHHRLARVDRGVERSGVRRQPPGRVLRAGHRDPDPALDRLRRVPLRRGDGPACADDDAGAGLHLADLVHAGELIAALVARYGCLAPRALPAFPPHRDGLVRARRGGRGG